MSNGPDTSNWEKVGATDNAEFFAVEPGVLAVVPHEGCVDDEDTARQSVEFQHAYWRDQGRAGSALIFMDRVRDSASGARRVYGELPDPALIRGFALIGGTVFGRAVASVFIGLSRPAAPTKMFGDVERARIWLRQQIEAKP